MRDWQVKRRERTRHLIELGGLVAKAGLIELTEDDRAIIYGGLLAIADRLRDEPERAKALWGRRGRRGFGGEAEAGESTAGSPHVGSAYGRMALPGKALRDRE